MDDTYLDTYKAAEWLGTSPQYVRRLCLWGRIKAEKIGGRWLIRESSIEEFLSRYNTHLNTEDETNDG